MRIREFLGIIGIKSKELPEIPISWELAKKYQDDKDYQDYFFEPVIEEGEMRYIPILGTKQEEKSVATLEDSKPIQKTKTKRNLSFINDITGNGAYQGIDRKVRQNRIDREQSTKKYGDWQKNANPKRYKTFETR